MTLELMVLLNCLATEAVLNMLCICVSSRGDGVARGYLTGHSSGHRWQHSADGYVEDRRRAKRRGRGGGEEPPAATIGRTWRPRLPHLSDCYYRRCLK